MTTETAPETQEKIHIPVPALTGYHTSDPHETLSDSEQELYNQVLAPFTKEDYVIPEMPEEEKGGLTEDERFWLSRHCLLRYLRASKWDAQVAIQKIEATLRWRRENRMDDPSYASSIEPEAVTGKHVMFGFDIHGRPAFYAFPSRQNTEDVKQHLRFTFWIIERGIDMMAPGVETFDALINFAERAAKPNYGEAMSIISILHAHYPERLGICSIINVPFFINAFLKLVLPFVDPVTRAKVKFNQSVLQDGVFTEDMLMKEWEGNRHFEYEHHKYWPALIEMCENNSKRWKAKWRALGGKIGISEWDYKHVDEDEKLGNGDLVVSGISAQLASSTFEDNEKQTEVAVVPVVPETLAS
ncbi:CRAL/TRIO domain-containing protein [Coprinopsis marcescibilis]|uniref:CRAL/TRIO domain-containing protein n=1 Tax=Coprinopsis marcescibilis TaxID=230819 RepID=A0A5C3L3V8_COPMA|nr:CRAL/TRIO domain-containing protein [Coprinopsis marcescibilis]